MNIRAKHVQAMATILDTVVPGWYKKIDTSILSIALCHRCILGQLFGSFFVPAAKSLWDNEPYANLSLFIHIGISGKEKSKWSFSQRRIINHILIQRWKNEINQRLAQTTPQPQHEECLV